MRGNMDTLELKKRANEVRKGIVTAVHGAKAGHPGPLQSHHPPATYKPGNLFLTVSPPVPYHLLQKFPVQENRMTYPHQVRAADMDAPEGKIPNDAASANPPPENILCLPELNIVPAPYVLWTAQNGLSLCSAPRS